MLKFFLTHCLDPVILELRKLSPGEVSVQIKDMLQGSGRSPGLSGLQRSVTVTRGSSIMGWLSVEVQRGNTCGNCPSPFSSPSLGVCCLLPAIQGNIKHHISPFLGHWYVITGVQISGPPGICG